MGPKTRNTCSDELVDWFFKRMRAIWGWKFDQQYHDEELLRLAKLEWAARINRYTKRELHDKLEMAKCQLIWPDVNRIMAIPRRQRPVTCQPAPTEAARQARVAAGEQAMADLLDLFGGGRAKTSREAK